MSEDFQEDSNSQKTIRKKDHPKLINEEFLSKEHLYDIINFLPDATFVINSTGHVIAWNRAMEDLTQVEAGDILGKDNYEYAIPFYGERRQILIDLVLTTRENVEVTYDRMWRDESTITAEIFIPQLKGKPTYLWGKATKLYNQKGVVIGAIESIRDITEKKKTDKELEEYRIHLEDLVEKRTEELRTTNFELQLEIKRRKKVSNNLRISEENYRSIFENTGTATLIIREDDSIAMVNTEFEKLSGYSKGEVLGSSWTTLISPEDVDRMMKYRQKRIEDPTSVPNQYEFKYITRQGKTGDAYMTIAQLPGTKQYIASVMDITGHKLAERELNNLNLKLKRSNAELEQFAYVASHDLQEPLRMISSFTQLLERDYKGKLDKNADEYLYFIVDGAQRMGQLINDLLDYSRVNTQMDEYEKADLEDVLKIALKNIQLSVEENNAQITYDALPTVLISPSLISQVFQNLISNALKYRSTKQPKIHISSQEEGEEHVISVKDNGIGISYENLNRIFVIFQRLHTRDEYKGTGIGLAITQKIVEEHGGRIWVESEPAKGSTFYFTIPK
jgi:PAS domain S-box-containing protein